MKMTWIRFCLSVWMMMMMLCSQKVSATPLEGSMMPSEGHWKMGFQYNLVEEQDVDYQPGEARSDNRFYTLQYGLTDFLTLDFKLGVGDLRYRRDGDSTLDYSSHFAGGYGLRWRPQGQENSDLKYVLGAHHICVHPHSYHDTNGDHQEVIWDGWQLDGFIYHRFGSVTPYLGGKVKRVFLIRKINGERVRMKSDVQLGLALGVDLVLPGDWLLNMEARFLDEEAYTVGISYIF